MLRISLLVRSLCPTTAASPEAASLWISWAGRGLAWVCGAAAAVRRWQMRRWLKRNRHRIALIALIACDAHELSELGRRVRAETLRELQDRLRDLRPRDLDPRTRGDGPLGGVERRASPP